MLENLLNVGSADPAEFDAALGARPTQTRTWTRVLAHSGHTDCFNGTGLGADLVVCAVPTGKGSEHEIRSAYLNLGRAVGKPWRVAPRKANLPQALRAAFRGLA